jgi:hypothetical protein
MVMSWFKRFDYDQIIASISVRDAFTPCSTAWKKKVCSAVERRLFQVESGLSTERLELVRSVYRKRSMFGKKLSRAFRLY